MPVNENVNQIPVTDKDIEALIKMRLQQVSNRDNVSNVGPDEKALQIVEVKQHRVDIDAVLQRVKSGSKSRERSIVITKLQEAIMWLGMELKEIGAPNPYPNSYNPGNTIVDKTADGLKL